jgi:hypothetical protein
MTDIIERAEAAIKDNYPSPHLRLLAEVTAELKAARAENARLVNLLRCAKEGCDGNH